MALVYLKKLGSFFAPKPQTASDGRDQWPSRTAYLLASMGGCAGMGNLLRYPSQVFNNSGLQWFIPYLMCTVIIAIPVLVLEIAIGNAYRGGSVVAFNNINRRLKGTGLSLLYIGFVVGPYFVVNLAWIMSYFRHSFTSPLPWTGRATEFFNQDVVANVDPIPGTFSADGKTVLTYTQYPGIKLIGETVGWTLFTWFLCWLSIFRGVGLTGRVVYFTMGLPIAMTIVLIGRSLSLPNASEGVKHFWATWNGYKLADPTLWVTACGQVFFSTGVGFGYFTSYASYNRKHSDAVMDAILIVSSNVVFENVAAFAVYGVIGFIGLYPEPGVRIGGFTVGFLTLPPAITEMPGSNFWAVALFFTLMVLGYSSAFVMLDAIVTLVMDAKRHWSRPMVVTALAVLSFLLSLPYATEFGYYLLDGIDRWTNDLGLVFVVMAEATSATTFYRWRDVAGQVTQVSFILYNVAVYGGVVIGIIVAHTESPEVGAGVGFGIFIVGTVIAVLLATTPDVQPPRFWGKNYLVSRFWYLAFYSGNQLRRDLNALIGHGKNWKLPFWWPVLLRYVSAPILGIIFSFSYPNFYKLRNDPLHILGFGVAHIALIIIGLGVIIPRWFNIFIPPNRLNDGDHPYAPCKTIEPDESETVEENESKENDSEKNENKTESQVGQTIV